jgi:GAF domain-containing protein
MAKRYRQLQQLFAQFGTHIDLEDLLQQYADQYSRDGKPAFAMLMYLNRAQEVLEQVAIAGPQGLKERMKQFVPLVPAQEGSQANGLCAYTALTRQSVLVPDVHFDKRYVSYYQRAEEDRTRSELLVPLLLGKDSEVIGVLNLESPVPGLFTQRDLEHFESVAPALAMRVELETQDRTRQLLTQALEDLADEVTPDKILETLLEHVLKLTRVEHGCVFKVDRTKPDGRDLLLVAGRNVRLRPGQLCAASDFLVISKALTAREKSAYWTLRQNPDKEEYTDIVNPPEDKGGPRITIQSNFARCVTSRDGTVYAVLNVESTSVGITERYQEGIGRLTDHVGTQLQGLEARKADLIADMARVQAVQAHWLMGSYKRVEELDPGRAAHPSWRYFAYELKSFLDECRRLPQAITAEPRQLPLAPLLKNAQDRAEAMGITLDVEVQEGCPATVWGTEFGVGAILGNLLHNTWKHTKPPLEAQIAVTWGGDHAELVYVDGGGPPADPTHPLDREGGGQGVKHVKEWCGHLGWRCKGGPPGSGPGGFGWHFWIPFGGGPGGGDARTAAGPPQSGGR